MLPFFIFGFVTWANGTLIPFLKCHLVCARHHRFSGSYRVLHGLFFLAIPSSWILKQTGFKNGIVAGLVVLALGGLIFIPAAHSHSFGLFLTGIFVQGAALALLQTAVNPYLSIIGPIDSAAKRISMAGICNKLAGIIVPFIMGVVFLKMLVQQRLRYRLLQAVKKCSY
ncbi:MFS transporter [Niabella hibiscisoli]|uniref:hypothetical protein n=1 Tax=Niabella hibiscisoli TaxID=1825928 RepID=UPI001F0DA696|nr:hypothetical protein [Niabella hibiscisoli]MCH5719339.1 hypothetical protein [Niabella hibiscisoli]